MHLIHGGLWEDMNAQRFWHKPGVVRGLEDYGFNVLAPDRADRPASWQTEVDHLAPTLPDEAVTMLGGSNGCSVAVRLALKFPDRVAKLLLAWPATAGDPAVDALRRVHMVELGASPTTVTRLLEGKTLYGVTDTEIAALQIPVAVLPAHPQNKFHQRRTVDALHHLIPRADELPGCPEPPTPDFGTHLSSFVEAVAKYATP